MRKERIFWIVLSACVFLYSKECGNNCVQTSVTKNVPDKESVKDKPVPNKIVPNSVSVTKEGRTEYEPVVKRKDWLTRFFSPKQVDTFWKDVDTAEIIKDFLSSVFYSDTIKNKFGYIVIVDTVSHNRLQGRSVLTDMDIPTTTITQTLKPKAELYGGGIVGFGIGAGLTLKTKKDRLISLDYMLTQHGGIISLGYKVPIKFGL